MMEFFTWRHALQDHVTLGEWNTNLVRALFRHARTPNYLLPHLCRLRLRHIWPLEAC
jgi:hypothetical protein